MPHTIVMVPSCVVFLCCLLWLQVSVAAGEHVSEECMDSQLTSTMEYVSILKYKTIKTTNRNVSTYMITQCSVDRLFRLEKQIKGWRGATSAAIYIPTKNHAQQMSDIITLETFMTKLQKDDQYSGQLTVSVLFGHESTPQLWNCKGPHSPGMPLYPINALRNLAAAATGSETAQRGVQNPSYLMYLDADFVPSAGLSDWIDKQAVSMHGKGSFHQLTQHGDLIVIPAFESTAPVPATPTRSLQYLLDGIQADSIHGFHVKRYPAGHGNTDFEKWQKKSAALKSEPADYPFHSYKVKYTQGFEPYIIMARSAFVPYDERFRGYGFNKCVNLRWLADNGRQFHVLPGHFVVEDAHANSITYNKTATNVDILFGAYNAARRDISVGRMPWISRKTAELLRAAGFGKVATEDPETHAAYLRSVSKPVK